jgi:porin
VTAHYQYEVRSGWALQPNFQYLVHPAAGATNPIGLNPGKMLKGAAVLACEPF